MNISHRDQSALEGVGGAAVLGAGGVYAGVRLANSNIVKGFFAAAGATAGGHIGSVNPFMARWIGASTAYSGKLGELGAEHAGGVAHVAGKLANGMSDTALTHAAEAVTNLAHKPELANTVGKVATGVRREVVGAVAADAIGNAVPSAARIAVPLMMGIAGAAVGYFLLSNILN